MRTHRFKGMFNRRGIAIAMATTMAMSLACVMTPAARAQGVPALINYQGFVTDSGARPLEGSMNLEFSIYNLSTNGLRLWGPQTFQNVAVVDGRFNVLLGPTDASGDPIAEAFSGGNAFLSLRIASPGQPFGAEFLPRRQFLSVPYAFRALESESADVSDLLNELKARLDALEGGGGQIAAASSAAKAAETEIGTSASAVKARASAPKKTIEPKRTAAPTTPSVLADRQRAATLEANSRLRLVADGVASQMER